jgi:cytochrome P450
MVTNEIILPHHNLDQDFNCTAAAAYWKPQTAMEIHRVVLAVVSIVIVRFLLNKYKLKAALSGASEKNHCGEPRALPSRDPIFGLDTVIQGFRQMKEHRRMKSTYETFQRYGHTYQSFPFGRRSVSTIYPQNLQMIFTENDTFGVGPLREQASEPMIGRGIVSSDGAVWAHARTMIKPTFNKSQIADRKMFSAHVERFLQLLPRDGSGVDLQPLFDRLVRCFPLLAIAAWRADRDLQILDASSEFIFGESFDSLEPDCPEDSQKFLDSFSYAQQGVGKRVMLGRMDFLMRDRRFWESCAFIRDYTRKRVERAILNREGNKSHGGQGRYILAHELVQATEDRAVVCDQLLNVVFAGRDTPAVALTSVFFCIARSPETWKKIRDEVGGLKDEELTFDRLKTLRYVQSVIKEGRTYLKIVFPPC